MLNQVVCVGRLCKDLELKYTPQGVAVCENTLALNKKQKDKQDKAIFIKIVCYGRGAEILSQYCKKGDRVGVVGEIDFNQWQDKQGNKHTQNFISVEKVELLESKQPAPRPAPAQKSYPLPQERGTLGSAMAGVADNQHANLPEIDLDEIPF